MWNSRKTTRVISSVFSDDGALGKASEALGKAGESFAEAFSGAFKDFDKHFDEMAEGDTTRVESDKMVVDIKNTKLVVKGELSQVVLNGKVIWEEEKK